MDIKTRIRRSLARATCDKTELDRTVLRFKKCFDEASAAPLTLLLIRTQWYRLP